VIIPTLKDIFQDGLMEQNRDTYDENIRSALQGLKRKETDIVRLVEDSMKGLARPDTVQVSLEVDIQDHSVYIDDERIMKVLTSLATNAVEAMPEGGELSIGVKGNEEQVVITISDTGTGISKEDMDNILLPFFTTKPAGDGTGLGLPVAYNSVKMHSGKLEIESNADPQSGSTGTHITITLPRSRPDLTKVIFQEE
jgi:two-component system, NtrC family, sensor kinase